MRTLVALALVACSSPKHPQPEPPLDPARRPPASTADPDAPPVPTKSGAPPTRVQVVKDTYHGVAVDDPFQWLEANTPEVKEWTDAQNKYARGILDKLDEIDEFRNETAAIIR